MRLNRSSHRVITRRIITNHISGDILTQTFHWLPSWNIINVDVTHIVSRLDICRYLLVLLSEVLAPKRKQQKQQEATKNYLLKYAFIRISFVNNSYVSIIDKEQNSFSNLLHNCTWHPHFIYHIEKYL